MRLGLMVKAAREAKALSLSEAAELLGGTKAHLHAIESGAARNPTLKTLAALVIVFGLRPEALIATVLDIETGSAGNEDA